MHIGHRSWVPSASDPSLDIVPLRKQTDLPTVLGLKSQASPFPGPSLGSARTHSCRPANLPCCPDSTWGWPAQTTLIKRGRLLTPVLAALACYGPKLWNYVWCFTRRSSVKEPWGDSCHMDSDSGHKGRDLEPPSGAILAATPRTLIQGQMLVLVFLLQSPQNFTRIGEQLDFSIFHFFFH